jgi:hypothetical protein
MRLLNADEIKYYNLRKNWSKVARHLHNPRVADTLVRNFNKFTYRHWRKRNHSLSGNPRGTAARHKARQSHPNSTRRLAPLGGIATASPSEKPDTKQLRHGRKDGDNGAGNNRALSNAGA